MAKEWQNLSGWMEKDLKKLIQKRLQSVMDAENEDRMLGKGRKNIVDKVNNGRPSHICDVT
jgi:hypothetical protein